MNPASAPNRGRAALGRLLLGGLLLAVLGAGGCQSLSRATSPSAAPRQAPPAEPVLVTGETAYVQAANLNLRRCPEPKCRILAVLPQGQAVRVWGRQAGWCQVELADGRQGWLAARYLAGQPSSPAQGGRQAAGAAPPVVKEEFAGPEAGGDAALPAGTPPVVREEFSR